LVLRGGCALSGMSVMRRRIHFGSALSIALVGSCLLKCTSLLLASPALNFISPDASSLQRRVAVQGALRLVGVSLTVPCAAGAEEGSKFRRMAVVESYPPYASLVPIFGVFDLARSAAQLGSDSVKLQFVRERFQRLSDQNLDALRFVCTTYIGTIKYTDPDEKVIGFDKAARFRACNDAMTAVAKGRNILKNDQLDNAAFQGEVTSIGSNLGGFFALVPPSDFQAVGRLSAALRALDTDKSGTLSDDEVELVGSGKTPLSTEDFDIVKALRTFGLRDLLIS